MNLRLNCPECEADIKYRDINIDKAIAKCHRCNTVFDFEKILVSTDNPKEKVFLPESMQAFYMATGFDLEISWRKSTPNFRFFLFFTILWNGFVSIFLIIAMVSGGFEVFWFMAFHIIVGVLLLYYVIAVYLNKTYIGVSQWDLTVEHKPLPMPFFKTLEIPSNTIEQVFVERYVASKTNGRPDYAFAVLLLQKENSKPIKIMKGLKTLDQGRFVEQEIEKFLHIKDKPMPGEWL